MANHPSTPAEERVAINDQSLLYCSDGSGEVVDISMRGLSFRQLTGTNWPSGAFKIDLLLENSTLLIEQIPCSLCPVTHTSGLNRWQQHLKFGPLSEEQTNALQEFICRQREQQTTLPLA